MYLLRKWSKLCMFKKSKMCVVILMKFATKYGVRKPNKQKTPLSCATRDATRWRPSNIVLKLIVETPLDTIMPNDTNWSKWISLLPSKPLLVHVFVFYKSINYSNIFFSKTFFFLKFAERFSLQYLGHRKALYM